VEAQPREPPAGRDHLSVVRYEVQDLVHGLRRRARGRGGRPAPVERLEDALEGIAVDLDRILGEREPVP
jgi:hypothetical protein